MELTSLSPEKGQILEMAIPELEEFIRAHRERAVSELFGLLKDAIESDFNADAPYYRMACLLWLLGDPAWAETYLHQALSLNPQLPSAWALLKLVQLGFAQTRTTVPVAGALTVIDPAALMRESLSARLENALAELQLLPPGWYDISDERSLVEQMERYYASLAEIYHGLNAPIRACEGRGDPGGLLERLQPLESVLLRYQEILTQSWQLIELKEALAGHNSWLEREVSRLAENRERLSALFSVERFDYLIEDCSALASQLENLQQNGVEVTDLLSDYDQMAGKVSKILDLLDEN
ncbi:MAG: hypothetical protein ACAI44_31325 [Candidatus Sericytochromatia bacterium]